LASVKKPDTIDDITLHEAIKRVINECGPAKVSEITAKVNEKGLYRRLDGNLIRLVPEYANIPICLLERAEKCI